MKTAAEWVDEYRERTTTHPTRRLCEWFAAVQRDALEAAADLVQEEKHNAVAARNRARNDHDDDTQHYTSGGIHWTTKAEATIRALAASVGDRK